SYVAMLPLLAVAVLITLTIARAAGIEESEGMHPIVPILTKGKDSPATVIAIFFLAVVLAPMIEEVMFRGFFYRFLRYHNDAPNSIFISAALFAGIHPQGMLGFFPLLAIGVALATLREWRNSLVAPMVLHACVNGVTLAGLLLMF
ncbi:CPBP family intramembrane metalloprotease, partial [Candidatus Sumerlaeota bacterium]|nr:CPBP family intramembrane metalloprotease [Candidatus Sumerlaeota bacterium]